jgi:hypothetical protein
MEQELTSKVDIGIVGVDLAGVCHDPRPGAPDGLHRLEPVLGAWRRQLSRHAEFRFFADRPLLKELGREGRRPLKVMRQAGELEVSSAAADLLLAHAAGNDGCLLAGERLFGTYRGRSSRPERNFTWAVGEEGVRAFGEEGVRIVRAGDAGGRFPFAAPAPSGATSDAGSLADLRKTAVRERWQCASDVPCLTRETSPDFLRVLPLIEREAILCPGCRQPPRPLGKRPDEAELQVAFGDETVARFVLGADDEIAFGRLMFPETARLYELARERAFTDVGKVHAQLRMDGDRVAVRPVDARHPVAMRRWSPRWRRLGRERELRHGDGFVPLEPRDRLLVGKRLELFRSPRSIAEAEELRRGDDSYWRLHTTGG